jgi:ferredoxin
METTIFYYTGTGNSLWIARTLAKMLGDVELVSISDWMKEKRPVLSKIVGVIFPVHMWGVPPPVIRFIPELKALAPQYLFALAVDAGQVANTLVQLKGLCKKQGLTLASGFEIKMPTNYIPWGGPENPEKQQEKFDLAIKKISGIITVVRNKESRPVEKGDLWQRALFTVFYKMSYPHLPTMDKSFRVDEKCNHCGICARVCPAENIVMLEGKPTWQHHCEQCLACIQWCPQEAIQYGKKTPAYKRYHQPEILLKDVLKDGSKGKSSK